MTIFYHGSDKLFDQFRLSVSRRGSAVFLTKDPRYARSYGKFVYTVEVGNVKLFDFRNQSHLADMDKWVTAQLSKTYEDYRKEPSFYPFTWEKVFKGIQEGAWHHLTNPLLTKYIKARFDGWIEIEAGEEQIAFTNVKKLKILDVSEYAVGDYPTKTARRVVARFSAR